jgi:hypothetical protein
MRAFAGVAEPSAASLSRALKLAVVVGLSSWTRNAGCWAEVAY